MTLLPGTNYMSNSARTEAEMKIALEKVNEVIAEIGSQDVTTLTISSGGIATPLSSMVSITPEGGGVLPDDLLTIAVSNIDKGRMVILKHANSATVEASGITITHGITAAAIEMLDGADFVLCAKRKICLIYTGATGHWKEVWRGYGRETVAELLAERTAIGLGDASVETIATAGNTTSKVLKVSTTPLVDGDVLKIDSVGQIVKATVTELGGGNAATLETHDAASFVRTNEAAAQSIDADLTVSTTNASLIADGTSTAALRLKGSGTERAFVELVESDGEMTIGTIAAGGGATQRIRLNPGGLDDEKFEYSADNVIWQSLTPGAGNGLLADILACNLSTTANASAGSFKISDGTTNLLVQWGGTWVLQGSASSSGRKRLTFAEAYTSTPHIIGGGYAHRFSIFTNPETSTVQSTRVYSEPTTITTTYIEIPRDYGPANTGVAGNHYFSNTGHYIAIGIVA